MANDPRGKPIDPETEVFRSNDVCPTCGRVGETEIFNHSLMWHDGDIYCKCGQFIRHFDAG